MRDATTLPPASDTWLGLLRCQKKRKLIISRFISSDAKSFTRLTKRKYMSRGLRTFFTRRQKSRLNLRLVDFTFPGHRLLLEKGQLIWVVDALCNSQTRN